MKTLDEIFRLDVEPLFFMYKDAEPPENSMCLTVVNGILSYNTISELFKFGKYADVAQNLLSASNKVAQQSRRGCGNYALVNLNDFLQTDLLLRVCAAQLSYGNRMELVLCEDVPDGEVWVFYASKKMSTNTDKYPIPVRVLMDGPFALFEDKLYINPKWDSYITKWKLPCNEPLTNMTLGKGAI